jgi:predicted O-methyltransferase YrrM
MFQNPLEFRAFTFELSMSVWTYSALGVLFESGLASELTEARTVDELATRVPKLSRSRIERCLGLAETTGALVREGDGYRLTDGVRPLSGPQQRTSMQGELRAQLMQALAFLDAARDGNHDGWRHESPALLRAQGDASTSFAPMFKAHLLGALDDLAARLESPEARMLDVGTGVGALAIAMCRAFPALTVVGVDAWDAPLDLARENVTSAGLRERIELRQLDITNLRDEAAFELAWLPSFFISESSLPAAVARVRAALKPGGWLLFPIGASRSSDARQQATLSLVCELWGGPALSASAAESMLGAAGFSSIRSLPGPAWAPMAFAAQR